jgi:hypothetical protein
VNASKHSGHGKPPGSGEDRRRALWHVAAAFVCLGAGVLAGALLHSDTVVWISAVTGFVFLTRFVRRALVLWEIDSPLFEDSGKFLRDLDRFRGI